eukprot:1773947-Amphidinium_carterae.1
MDTATVTVCGSCTGQRRLDTHPQQSTGCIEGLGVIETGATSDDSSEPQSCSRSTSLSQSGTESNPALAGVSSTSVRPTAAPTAPTVEDLAVTSQSRMKNGKPSMSFGEYTAADQWQLNG